MLEHLFAVDSVININTLEKNKKMNYSKKDKVLYNLDSGILNYYEGKYTDSIAKLTTAEKLIYDYYTKSITQSAAAFISNDNVIDYPGEDYEDIYLNLFKALAYYKCGKWEEGFHEINAYKRKAANLASRHDYELLMARQAVKINDEYDDSISFHDSALGEYLSLLYYRSIYDTNQVNFSARMIKDVFITSSDIYDFSIPTSIEDEKNVKKSDARLNFIVFSGQTPQKKEKKYYYSNELVLSLPELEIEKSKIKNITVTAINKENGAKYTEDLEPIEDIGNICCDIFKSRAKAIYYKSVARALAKGGTTVGSRIAGDILTESDSFAVSALGGLLTASSIVNENITDISEHADLRQSRFFPGRADIGGITVIPGNYDITVSFYAENERLVYKNILQDINVETGKLNLVSTSSTIYEINESNLKKQNSPISNNTVIKTDNSDKIEFDIGSEPDNNASATYGFFQYNWTKNFSSNIKLRYVSGNSIEDEIEGYTNSILLNKRKEFELDFLPVVVGLKCDLNLNLNAGATYQYIFEETFAGMFDTNGYMLDEIDIGKYFTMTNERSAHIFAPRIGVGIKKDINNLIGLNLKFYSNPIYFITLKQSMNYHSDQTTELFDYSGENSFSNWATPYVDIYFSIDLFKFLRCMTQFSYQKLDLQQMDWSEDYLSLSGFDDIQTIMRFRVGIELLAGNVKKARVRAGIYNQTEWNSSSYNMKNLVDNKWIIGIGSER